jgi:hypothetical protein
MDNEWTGFEAVFYFLITLSTAGLYLAVSLYYLIPMLWEKWKRHLGETTQAHTHR